MKIKWILILCFSIPITFLCSQLLRLSPQHNDITFSNTKFTHNVEILNFEILPTEGAKSQNHADRGNNHLSDVYPKFLFVETSEFPNLNFRQACALESAARHHPNSNVTLFMFSTNLTKPSIYLSKLLPNLNIIIQNLDSLFAGTPLFEWYKKGEWKRSPYRISHLSDALRYLLVWKYGGIYLDLDVVILKPLNGMKNFLILELSDSIASGMLGFEREHPLISICLRDINKYYKPYNFGCIGPELITRSFKSFCGVKSLDEISKCRVTLFPPVTAFPVGWKQWKDYFDKDKTSIVLRNANGSLMIHVWNTFSKNLILSPNSGSAYEELMKKHCPAVYDFIISNSFDF